MLAQAEAQKVAAERQLYRRHRIMRAVVEMREEDNFANRLREIYRETDEGAS